MPRALISVSDKRGVAKFARGLVDQGWEIISTGGTAHVIDQADVPVTPIEGVTGFPEIMNGRVKTLHPAVHAALLARRDDDRLAGGTCGGLCGRPGDRNFRIHDDRPRCGGRSAGP